MRARTPSGSVLAVAVLAVFCLASHVEASREAKAQKLFRQAQRELDAGRLEAAEELLTEATELDADSVDAHVQLGHISMSRRDWRSAIGHYHRAKNAAVRLVDAARDGHLRIYDQRTSLMYNYKDMLNFVRSPRYQGRDKQRKIVELEQKIRDLENLKVDPFDDSFQVPAELYFFLGNAYYHAERLDDALAEYEQALSLAEDFGPAHANVALILFQRGHYDAAWEHVHAARSAGVEPAAGFLADLRARAPEPDPEP